MPLRKVALDRRTDGSWPEPDGEIVDTISVGTEVLRLLVRTEEEDPEPGAGRGLDPADLSVSELRKELRGERLTDAEREVLLDLEKDGKNRKTAIEAIKDA